MLRKLLCKSINRSFLCHRGITALYLSGDKAKEHYAVLTPFMEIDKVMENHENLIENIYRRNNPTDIQRLYRRYDLYRNVVLGKEELERQREDIYKQITDQGTSNEDKVKLKLKGKEIRETLKSFRDYSYEIEEDFITRFLELPNDIHKNVPLQEEVIFSNIPEDLLTKESANHLEIDQERSIELVDVTNCFFKGDAARFDFLFPQFLCNHFTSERKFHQFSNPDFVRTVLLEGGSLDDKDRLFQVKEDHSEEKINLLHLCGSGSMLSYLGFITKLQIFPNVLPLRLISTGKQYTQVLDNTPSLFNLTQTTTVQMFGIAKDEPEALEMFNEMTNALKELYSRIPEISFRIVSPTAEHLHNNESLKVSLQMYSNHSKKFVEIANVVYYGEYISKRLLFSYKEQKENKFPHLVSATCVDIAKVIGCSIENSGNAFSLPDLLK